MKKAILLVAIGFSIMLGHAQEKTNHVTYYDYFKTIVKTRYQTIGNNVLHGHYKKYYKSGPIVEQSDYNRGKRTSRKIYTIDGEIILSLKFNNNGIPDGEQKRWVFDDRAYKHVESSATFNNGKLIKFSNHYYNTRYNKLGGKKTSFSNNHLSTLTKSGNKILDVEIIVDNEYIDTYSIGGYDYKNNIIVHSIENGFVLNDDSKVTYLKGKISKIESKEREFSYTANRIKERTYVVKRNFSNSIEIDTIVLKNEPKSTIHLKYIVSNDDYTLELGVEGDITWKGDYDSFHYDFDVNPIINNEDKSKYDYFIRYTIDNSGNTKSINNFVDNTLIFFYPSGQIKRTEDYNTGYWADYNENGVKINDIHMLEAKMEREKKKRAEQKFKADNLLSIFDDKDRKYKQGGFRTKYVALENEVVNKINSCKNIKLNYTLKIVYYEIKKSSPYNDRSYINITFGSTAEGIQMLDEITKVYPREKSNYPSSAARQRAKKYTSSYNELTSFNVILDHYVNKPIDKEEKKIWKADVKEKFKLSYGKSGQVLKDIWGVTKEYDSIK